MEMSVLLKLCTDFWGMLGLVLLLTGAGSVFATSLQDPFALLVLAVGVAFLAVHTVRAGRAKRIVADGQAVCATITRSSTSRYTSISTTSSQYGPDDPSLRHPMVVWFRYTYDGASYEGKSGLLWEAPRYVAGEQIKVYISQQHPEQYAL